MYAYYVEVPRILIFGSNFRFIPPVEFLEIFPFYWYMYHAHSAHLCRYELTYTYTIQRLFNIFEDIYTLIITEYERLH